MQLFMISLGVAQLHSVYWMLLYCNTEGAGVMLMFISVLAHSTVTQRSCWNESSGQYVHFEEWYTLRRLSGCKPDPCVPVRQSSFNRQAMLKAGCVLLRVLWHRALVLGGCSRWLKTKPREDRKGFVIIPILF